MDALKIINDRFGHDLGDNVLKIIASVCTSVRRGSDTAARLGGDEFGLLLPETSGEAASIVTVSVMVPTSSFRSIRTR